LPFLLALNELGTHNMKCPHCNQKQSRVVDTRESGDGIRRRRQCKSCGQRFTTYEQISAAVHIVKTDGRREPFDRIKLLNGIRISCAKREISMGEQEGLADQIEEYVHSAGKAEVPSSEIGNMVLDGLKVRKNSPLMLTMGASPYRRTVQKCYDAATCARVWMGTPLKRPPKCFSASLLMLEKPRMSLAAMVSRRPGNSTSYSPAYVSSRTLPLSPGQVRH